MKINLFQRVARIMALIFLAPLLGIGYLCTMLGEAMSLTGSGLIRRCTKILNFLSAPKERRRSPRRTETKSKLSRVK